MARKRYQSRRKTAPRRRRRPRGVRNNATSARYFKHKLTVVIPLQTTDNQSSHNTVHLHLQQPAHADAANVGYGFDSSARWASVYKNYEEYAVTGMKVKYIPTNVTGGIAAGADSSGSLSLHSHSIDPLVWWYTPDDLESYLWSDQQVISSDHMHIRPPNRVYSKWLSAKKLSNVAQVTWQKTDEYVAGAENGLTLATQNIKYAWHG